MLYFQVRPINILIISLKHFVFFQIAILVILFASPIHGCGKSGGCGDDTINAAVISKHFFKVKDVASSSQDIDIPTIVINSGSSPLKIQMGSSSSDIEIEQTHQGSKPQKKISSSIDGAIILNHFVKKPIVQRIHEVIVPTRKIVQEASYFLILPIYKVPNQNFFCKNIGTSGPRSDQDK